MVFRRAIFMIAALVFQTLAVTAQDSGTTYCGRSAADMAGQIAGDWSLYQNQGVAIGGVVPVPLIPTGPDRVTLQSAGGGTLVMTLPGSPQSMTLSPAAGDLDLPPGLPGFAGPDGEEVDIEASADCAWEDMPRFAGVTNYDLGGQGSMQMQLAVHFPNPYFGFGVLVFQGQMNASGVPTSFGAMRTVQFGRGS